MVETDLTVGVQGPAGPPARLCRFATTAALPLYNATAYTLAAVANGAFPVTDDISPAVGDLVFVKDETGGNAKNNGPYRLVSLGSSTTTWRLGRATDVALDTIGVRLGVENGGKLFMLATDGPVTLGTTALTYEPMAAGASAAPVLAQVNSSPFAVLPEHTILEVNVSPAVLNFPSLDDVDPGAEMTVVDRANNASLSPIQLRYLGVQFGSIDADGKSARVYASIDGWRQHQF